MTDPIRVKVTKEHLEESRRRMKGINQEIYPELSDLFQRNNPLVVALEHSGYTKVSSGFQGVTIGRNWYVIKDEVRGSKEGAIQGLIATSFRQWIKSFGWSVTDPIELLPRSIIITEASEC